MPKQSYPALMCLFLVVGCDYGVEYPEGYESFEYTYEADEMYETQSGALIGINGEPLLKAKIQKSDLRMAKMPLLGVDWLKNKPENQEDDSNDFCDCSGMCNACMDAYICGHEAAILEYCDDCAQCQKECTPDGND